MEYFYSMDSTWNGHLGFHLASMFIPPGFHMESTWNGDLEYNVRIKNKIEFIYSNTIYSTSYIQGKGGNEGRGREDRFRG